MRNEKKTTVASYITKIWFAQAQSFTPCFSIQAESRDAESLGAKLLT